MIFYNSLLAKWFLGKGKKHYFMLGWFFFTRYKYLEVWEDMELRIHARQYWECFSLTLIPALILSLLLSWWWMVLPFVTYHILYWFEKIICHHSIFNWEAMKHWWRYALSQEEESVCLEKRLREKRIARIQME